MKVFDPVVKIAVGVGTSELGKNKLLKRDCYPSNCQTKIFFASADPQSKSKSRVPLLSHDNMLPSRLRPLLSLFPIRGPITINRHPPLSLPFPILNQLRFRGVTTSGQGMPWSTQKRQSFNAYRRYRAPLRRQTLNVYRRYPVAGRNPQKKPRRIKERKGLWRAVKDIEALPRKVKRGEKLKLRVEDMDTPMVKAAWKRWNGRRSLYLGNWKNRRDAAFMKHEDRGVPFERTGHPVIDGVLGREKREVDSYPCVKLEKRRKKKVKKVPTYRVASDFAAV